MPQRTISSITFDFNTFLGCKPFLAAKDKHIVAQAVAIMLAMPQIRGSSVRFLDVGTGEASVISQLCRDVASAANSGPAKITVDCVEPSAEAAGVILDVARKSAGSNVEVVLREMTIESFLRSPTATYDAINCCHVLYHIRKELWSSIAAGLIAILRPGGVLLVNLVSNKSDIYAIKQHLQSNPEFDRLPKNYERFGFDYYAEDFEPLIDSAVSPWTIQEINARITFSRDEVNEALAMSRRETSSSDLIRFLSFMYRVNEEAFARTVGEEAVHLIAGKGATLSSIDKMFIYRKAEGL